MSATRLVRANRLVVGDVIEWAGRRCRISARRTLGDKFVDFLLEPIDPSEHVPDAWMGYRLDEQVGCYVASVEGETL